MEKGSRKSVARKYSKLAIASYSELRLTLPLTFLWNYHTQTNESILKKQDQIYLSERRGIWIRSESTEFGCVWKHEVGWVKCELNMRLNTVDCKPSLAPRPSATWTGITFTHGFAFFTTPCMESSCWDQVQSLKRSVCVNRPFQLHWVWSWLKGVPRPSLWFQELDVM